MLPIGSIFSGCERIEGTWRDTDGQTGIANTQKLLTGVQFVSTVRFIY